MSRAKDRAEAAMAVADWLEDQGESTRAHAVRAACQSLVAADTTFSAMRTDNAALRNRLEAIDMALGPCKLAVLI